MGLFMYRLPQLKFVMGKLFTLTLISIYLLGCQPLPGVAPKGASPTKISKSPSLGKSPKLNSSYAQFPDIPFPAGATINSERTTIVGSKPWYGLLSLSSNSNAGLMYEFFDSKMESYRWQKIASVRATTSILTFMKNNRVLTISIKERAIAGSEVSITSSPINKSQAPSQNPDSTNNLVPVPVQKIN